MKIHEKINYVEFPAKDIIATKIFFTTAFGWTFTDYGPDYTAFENEGLDGGFYTSEQTSTTENGSALVIFYSNSLK
jgi:predicted enzyme related to lactoylglutathione lyase